MSKQQSSVFAHYCLLASYSESVTATQRERQKINRFRLAKQQLCMCITLFCTFLCRHCTTITCKCLNSRFVEDGNIRQKLSFSFPELWCIPLEFNSKNICQIKRDGISEIRFEATRIDFFSDAFVAFAVVVAYAVSIPAAPRPPPTPPPGLLRGICPPFQSRGADIC